jgi:hypothetical protein
MPIGDDQEVELASVALLVGDVPAAAVGARSMVHAVAELDVLQEAERVGVRVEVCLDVRVVRKRRIVVGHRKVLEAQPLPRGVDVQ